MSYVAKCDFQDGLCGLTEDSKVRWSIGSGSTPTKDTGPDYDHSTYGPAGGCCREDSKLCKKVRNYVSKNHLKI